MNVDDFKEFWNFLEGKKTNIVGALIIVLAVLSLFDVIPKDKLNEFISLMVGLGFLAVRSGINKIK